MITEDLRLVLSKWRGREFTLFKEVTIFMLMRVNEKDGENFSLELEKILAILRETQ
jgi:hypothetical protein